MRSSSPVFLNEDNDNDHLYGGGQPYSNSNVVYSDISSHGAYGQPAHSVGHRQESYGIRELGGGPSMDDPFAVGVTGGAAGIGIA
jgi:hypothetical protein